MNSDGMKSLEELTIGQKFELEELLDRPSLVEMSESLEDLFGVSLRIYSASGALLADTRSVPALYALLEQRSQGRAAVQKVIDAVRRATPKKGIVEATPCISGGRYLVSAVVHDGRVMGKTIFGPFLSPELSEMPEELLTAASDLPPEEVQDAWERLPRLNQAQVVRIDGHLRATLDVLIFSGLKAYLASNLHLASVKESFRELAENNQKLQHAYDRLKELDRLKSNFLATVSHELRTPLTSIIGYSEMLLEGIGGDLNDEQREFVDTIHEKGEQLLHLIKSLLDLSKLESGTMSLRKRGTDCDQLVHDVVSTLTPTAMKKGVKLIAAAQKGTPELYADPERLRQVLLNLTENAIKFTGADGAVTVGAEPATISLDDEDGPGAVLMAAASRPAVRLTVADTGIGIGEEEKARVFDAFYQVDSSSTREAGGTGLGLSIVKRLVDAHDGTIEIEANQPRGAVFVVTIPIKKPSR